MESSTILGHTLGRGAAKAHLVGICSGAAVAFRVLADRPERVASIFRRSRSSLPNRRLGGIAAEWSLRNLSGRCDYLPQPPDRLAALRTWAAASKPSGLDGQRSCNPGAPSMRSHFANSRATPQRRVPLSLWCFGSRAMPHSRLPLDWRASACPPTATSTVAICSVRFTRAP